MTDETVERSPIGKDAKLNELIFLAMFAACDEMGKGFEQAVLKRHADKAAELWAEHLMRITTTPVDAGLVERLRAPETWDAVTYHTEGSLAGDEDTAPFDAADAIEELLQELDWAAKALETTGYMGRANRALQVIEKYARESTDAALEAIVSTPVEDHDRG